MKIQIHKIVILLSLFLMFAEASLANTTDVRIPGHVPKEHISKAVLSGSAALDKRLSLAVALPLINQQKLEALIQKLHDPKDPLFGKYLTTAEFTAEYSPTQADYDAVINHFRSQGYAITKSYDNRLLLNVEASVATIENSLKLKINEYTDKTHSFHAPDSDPALPSGIGTKVSAVLGLDNAAVLTPNYKRISPASQSANASQINGTGPGNYLSPSDIKTAYNLKQ